MGAQLKRMTKDSIFNMTPHLTPSPRGLGGGGGGRPSEQTEQRERERERKREGGSRWIFVLSFSSFVTVGSCSQARPQPLMVSRISPSLSILIIITSIHEWIFLPEIFGSDLI